MIKTRSDLPPRAPIADRTRPLSPPPEPAPAPRSEAFPGGRTDQLVRAPHAPPDLVWHAPPPAFGNFLDPATSPLPPRQLFRTKGVDIVSYGASSDAINELGCAIGAVASNPTIAAAMNREKVAVVVIPQNTRMTDLPEFASLSGKKTFDGRLWDDVRGVGGLRLADGRLAVGIPEENLTNSSADRYWGNYSVAIHELAHVVQDHCISDREFRSIKRLYDDRKAAGLPFTDTYATANHFEYFAQATNVYFGRNEGQGINSRQWLANNDPLLYAKLCELYPLQAIPTTSNPVPVAEAGPTRGNAMLDLLRRNNQDPDE